MYTGQLNRSDPFDALAQQVKQNNIVEGDDSEATFALLYEEILNLSGAQSTGTGSCSSVLDIDVEGEILATYGSNLPPVSINDRFARKPVSFSNHGPIEELRQNASIVREVIPGSSALGSVDNAITPDLRNIRSIDEHVPLIEDSLAEAGPVGNIEMPSKSGEVLNKRQLVAWMDAHALSRSKHHCAMYYRLGLEAAGVHTEDRPVTGDAGDYGPFLLRHGAQVVPQESYSPHAGDTAVFDKTEQHPFGHIEIFDGQRWVSDFMQHGFSPYRDASTTPPFTIYRLA